MPDLDTHIITALLERADALLERLATHMPAPPPAPDWGAHAFRWRAPVGTTPGWLEPVHRPHALRLADLCCIDAQRDEIDRNTRQFLAGGGANNVLLSGARGTGKSSLIKALFNTYRAQGLRLIEVDKERVATSALFFTATTSPSRPVRAATRRLRPRSTAPSAPRRTTC